MKRKKTRNRTTPKTTAAAKPTAKTSSRAKRGDLANIGCSCGKSWRLKNPVTFAESLKINAAAQEMGYQIARHLLDTPTCDRVVVRSSTFYINASITWFKGEA